MPIESKTYFVFIFLLFFFFLNKGIAHHYFTLIAIFFLRNKRKKRRKYKTKAHFFFPFKFCFRGRPIIYWMQIIKRNCRCAAIKVKTNKSKVKIRRFYLLWVIFGWCVCVVHSNEFYFPFVWILEAIFAFHLLLLLLQIEKDK